MTQKPKIDPWKRGDALTARKLDQSRQAINLIVDGMSQPQSRQFVGASQAALFRIAAVAGDYLLAVRVLGDSEATQQAKVAKPPLLRNSVTSRAGATYSYSDVDARTATVGSDTEDQVVVPAYRVNDYIFAMSTPLGGTGVDEAQEWLDINADARAWAKEG